MSDSLIYDRSVDYTDTPEIPFLKKETVYVDDQNNGNYTSNQVTIETTTLSNNGRWLDYREGYLSIPLLITLEGENFTADNDIRQTDMAIALKNSNLNIIDSLVVDYGNNNVVQLATRINAYLNFKLHSELSHDDELINGATINYSKDSSTSWRYSDAPDSHGTGINNNVNSAVSWYTSEMRAGANKGIGPRQDVFTNIDQSTHSDGKELIYGDTDKMKATGMNYISNTNTHKAYYYNCIIRLKDLVFFESLPLLKGANIRFTLNVNQCHFKVEKTAAGALQFNPSNFTGGNTNPIMVCASHITGTEANGNTAVDVVSAETHAAGGSQNLPISTTYDVTCSISNNNFTNIGVPHSRRSVRLYVPAYTMTPAHEKKYLELGQKKVVYTDIVALPKLNISGEFNFLITNGLARMKKLICVPVIASTANGTESEKFSPFVSPFSTEPATCSPYLLTNFNVQLGGLNVYQNNKNYSYETFLDEVAGKFGIEGNQTTGLCSSRISLNDYTNNYGYLVCDISRRSVEDETTPISLQVSGKVESLLPLDMFFYTEIQKSITIDLRTGQQVE